MTGQTNIDARLYGAGHLVTSAPLMRFVIPEAVQLDAAGFAAPDAADATAMTTCEDVEPQAGRSR